MRICLRGHKPFGQAVQAVSRALVEQRGGVPPADPPSGTALVERYSEAAAHGAMERRWWARARMRR